MLSTEMSRALVPCLCTAPGRCGGRGALEALSRASVMSTVGPLLLLAVGPLILLVVAIHFTSGSSSPSAWYVADAGVPTYAEV